MSTPNDGTGVPLSWQDDETHLANAETWVEARLPLPPADVRRVLETARRALARVRELEATREDTARLDWLESVTCADRENPHGKDVVIGGSHAGPAIEWGAWLNEPGVDGPARAEFTQAGGSIREAIDAARRGARDGAA